MSRRLRPAGAGALTGALTGLLALGPALGPGYLLFYDMVFVPRLGFSERTLGIDGSVPRAVPNDVVVAVLSQIMPGWVVQKLLLLGAFVLAGWGVGRFLRSNLGAVAAALAVTWNPWVAERLAIGHWGFVLGYAGLPWVAHAAGAARSGAHRDRARLLASLVLVGLAGSTASVLALLIAAAVLLVPWRGLAGARGTWVVLLGGALLANAAWLFPFLVLAPRSAADPLGVSAFASRADTPWGLWPSLLTGGGIWNTAAWFGDRQSWVVSGVAVAVVLGVGVWAVRVRWWRRSAAYPGLVVAGLIGVLLAGLSALPVGRDVVTWVVVTVPGGGLLRDSHKLTAVWVLVTALASGGAAQAVRAWVRRRGAERAAALLLAGVLALWPLTVLPSLAWGASGRWAAVDYPPDVLEVADALNAASPGGVAVLPWQLYRRYAWNGNRVTLDPWQRLLHRRVLVNDDLSLVDDDPARSTRTVVGESADARLVKTASASGANLAPVLRPLGIRYAVVQLDQPSGGFPPPRLEGARVLLERGDVIAYDLGPVTPASLERREAASSFRPEVARRTGLFAQILALATGLGYCSVSHRRAQRVPAELSCPERA